MSGALVELQAIAVTPQEPTGLLFEFTEWCDGGIEEYDEPPHPSGLPPLRLICWACAGDVEILLNKDYVLRHLRCVACDARIVPDYPVMPPRPPRNDYYVYTITDVDGAVRYVGKGTGDRDSLSNERNPLVTALIRAGRALPAQRLYEGLTEDEALRVEGSLIAKFGRVAHTPGGTLFNISGPSPWQRARAAIEAAA
jgi:hypothetical protein